MHEAAHVSACTWARMRLRAITFAGVRACAPTCIYA